MGESIEIRIPSEPKFLKITRAVICQVCEIMGFSPEDCNNITLAVDEACSNIIKHAYGGSPGKPIHVTGTLFQDRLEILLRDFGKKADINTIKSRELDDVRPGGLGVHLIKSVMDIVNYNNRLDEGNQLQLVKFIQKKE
jgi:anti-sigma regulatory factor (Ser/Thr protein kinase)